MLADETSGSFQRMTTGASLFHTTLHTPSKSYRFIRLRIVADREKKQMAVRQMEVLSGGKNVALMKFTREYGTGWDHGHAPFLVDGMPSRNDGPDCPVDACPAATAPLLRKVFAIKKEIRQATLYFAALGMQDVTINGQKVGNDVLDLLLRITQNVSCTLPAI